MFKILQVKHVEKIKQKVVSNDDVVNNEQITECDGEYEEQDEFSFILN